MIGTAGLCVSAGACSFLTRMEGTSASGRTLSGCSYRHGSLSGEGTVRCSDGRTGTFSMVSTSKLLGPGHSEGRGEGTIGDESFAFTY